MTQALVDKPLLDKVSFLIGDWRGTGMLDYPGPPVKRANYEILAMCKRSPDLSQLLFVTFNDDPDNHTMFHATQAFIFVDRESGQLRIKRNWLMESDNEGFVTIEKLEQKEDPNNLGFTVISRQGVPDDFQHDGTIQRVNESEMVITGEVKVQGKKYPYVDRYTRRDKPKPK
jgi:hypothetical protein